MKLLVNKNQCVSIIAFSCSKEADTYGHFYIKRSLFVCTLFEIIETHNYENLNKSSTTVASYNSTAVLDPSFGNKKLTSEYQV